MSTKVFLTIALSLILTGRVEADVVDTGAGCHFLPGKEKEAPIRVCSESFPGLWAGAEGKAVRYIEITGYAAFISGVPHLFASKDMYIYSAGKGGIRLGVPPQESALFHEMVSKGRPITVTGSYLRGADAVGDRSLGGLDVMPGRFWLAAMPDELPDSSGEGSR